MSAVKIMILFMLLAFLTYSCGIYNNQFERGGELTSNFLDRIQENPKGEDVLLSADPGESP